MSPLRKIGSQMGSVSPYCAAFSGSKKQDSLKIRKTSTKEKHPMDRPKMHVVLSTCFHEIALLSTEKCALQKCIFSKCASLHFQNVFCHVRGARKKKSARGPISVFFGKLKWAHLRIREAPFGKVGVVCVCVLCRGVPDGALNDVFLSCVFERYDAVSHLCATRKTRLGDLLSRWRKVPLQSGPQCKMRMCCLLCVDVKCEQICCLKTIYIMGGIFHQKGPKTDMTFFLFLGLPSPHYGS